jgi:hypothetical protein
LKEVAVTGRLDYQFKTLDLADHLVESEGPDAAILITTHTLKQRLRALSRLYPAQIEWGRNQFPGMKELRKGLHSCGHYSTRVKEMVDAWVNLRNEPAQGTF